MSWQMYTAISVIGLSVSVILQRVLLHKHKTDPVAYSVVFQLYVAAILLVASVVAGFSLAGIGDVWLVATICIVLYGVGNIVYSLTLQRVEASAFSMLFATHAVWVMALGILLFNESLTMMQLLGSVLLFISIAILAKNIGSIFKEKGTLLGLLTGLLYGLAVTSWTYVGREVNTLSWAAVSFAGSALVSFLVQPQSYKKMLPLFKGVVASKIIVLAIFYAVGSTAMLFAYKYGSLTIVSPLRQTGIIVTTLLALAVLESERVNIPKKIAAAVISSIGVVLIVI